VHLGTDLGVSDSRTNVGIYNASDREANARIEIRRACDNAVVDQRTVTVPANTTSQIGGLVKGIDTCGGTPSTFAWILTFSPSLVHLRC
jgi:hypothetical protein